MTELVVLPAPEPERTMLGISCNFECPLLPSRALDRDATCDSPADRLHAGSKGNKVHAAVATWHHDNGRSSCRM